MSELNKIAIVDSEHCESVLRELSELRKNKRIFRENVADLNDKTNFSVLKAIIDYMYSGLISFALVFKTLLLKTLDYFKMKPVKEQCETVLLDSINEENCLAMLGVADELYHAKLRDASVHFIIENFKKIYGSNDFKEINKNQLESVLKKIDGGNAETTSLTYLAIVGWVKHDIQNRKDYLEELLDYLSVENLSHSRSREIILNDNFLKNDPGGCKWLVKTFSSSNSSVMKNPTPPLFILSRFTRSVYKFDLYDKMLSNLKTRPSGIYTGAIAKYKHSIYVFKREIKPESENIALKYNTIENSWTEFTTNSRALTKLVRTDPTGICTKDDKFFMVGDWHLIYELYKHPFVSYNLETNVWTSLPDLKFTRLNTGIFSYNSAIYVLGKPFTGDCCVERYDDREGKWFTECEDFKLPYGFHSSVVISECIYSLSIRTGQLFKFDPRSSKFDVDNLKSFPTESWWEIGHLASIDGRLYVASDDGISEYNFHLNDWDEILKTSFVYPTLLS